MSKRVLIAALLVAAAAGGVWWMRSHPPRTVDGRPAAPASEVVATTPVTYLDEIGRIDRLIADEAALFEANGSRDPTYCVRLAEMYQSRARLTGDYDDYARAEEWIGRGFSVAPRGLGPHVSRAGLHFTLHRLDQCARDIEVARGWVAMPPTMLGQLVQLEADLAFQQGRYDDAVRELLRAYSQSKDPRAGARLALALAPLGKSDQAAQLLAEAEAKIHGPDPIFRSWVQLQRGLLELAHGQPETALGHYRRADRSMPGWWLVQEHIAEALAQTGKLEEARDIYERVVADTGHPEMMAALAGVLAELGDEDGEVLWREQALAKFEARLAMFPEAAAGHALEFFLELEDDGERALEMAQANFQLRPNGTASTLLARAYLKVGRVDDAVRTAQAALESGWLTADLLATASRALEAAGEQEAAATAAEQARALNPRAFD